MNFNDLQKAIIKTLQERKGCSQKELSSLLFVTPAAISQNTKPLIDDNILLFQYEIDKAKAGRKEQILALNPNSFFSIGIDFEKDEINYIEVNANKEIIYNTTFKNIEEIKEVLSNKDLSKCIGISVSLRKFYSINVADDNIKSFYEYLLTLNKNVTILNNLASLAYAYKLNHPKDENYVIIKYGPGLGSALFIYNKLLTNDNYPTYEIGKMLIGVSGKTVEDYISYSSFSSNKIEALEKLKNDESIRNKVLETLAFAIENTNTLLQLDKVLVSGDIFQDDNIFNELIIKLSTISKVNYKVRRMENYKELKLIKSGLAAQYLFLTNK